MNLNLNQLFFDFSRTLADSATLLTEDSVRYFFFTCMLKQDPELNHFVMELPYDLMSSWKGRISSIGQGVGISVSSGILKSSSGKLRQELDMYYDNGNVQVCFEFKFHRNADVLTGNKSDSDFAHTDAAGRIINDMRRLAVIQPANRLKKVVRVFVYVTDDEMHNYLAETKVAQKNKKYRDMLARFYMSGGVFDSAQIAEDIPVTFYNCAKASFENLSEDTSEKESFSISARKRLYVATKINSPSFLNNNCYISIFEIDYVGGIQSTIE